MSDEKQARYPFTIGFHKQPCLPIVLLHTYCLGKETGNSRKLKWLLETWVSLLISEGGLFCLKYYSARPSWVVTIMKSKYAILRNKCWPYLSMGRKALWIIAFSVTISVVFLFTEDIWVTINSGMILIK